MPNKLNLTQKLLCNKIGKMFQLAASKCCYSEISFCKEWLRSNLNKQILDLDETLICQSKNYIFNSFKQELNIPKHKDYLMDQNAMYWIGYLFTYWAFMDEVDGEFILQKYDIKAILEQFDVLHTMSVKAAIKTIKKDYTTKAVLIDTVLHSN